jgi:hypothetical protein
MRRQTRGLVSSTRRMSFWTLSILCPTLCCCRATGTKLQVCPYTNLTVRVSQIQITNRRLSVIEFTPPSASDYKLFEISTSPLSMFYIPIYRTLKSVSKEMVTRIRSIVTQDEEGNDVVTEEVEEIPKERVINYTPIGNYKWSAIEVDTRDLEHPIAKLELVADGKVAYK